LSRASATKKKKVLLILTPEEKEEKSTAKKGFCQKEYFVQRLRIRKFAEQVLML